MSLRHLALAALLAVAAAPAMAASAPGVAVFEGSELSAFDGHCERRRVRGIHDDLWTLCQTAWRPQGALAPETAAIEKTRPLESYRLSWLRADAPRLDIRISAYGDGSGVVWVTRFLADGRNPEKIEVNTLSPAELATVLTPVHASPFWNGARTKAKACDSESRLILEGTRQPNHRAALAGPCDNWLADLGRLLLGFTATKIPGLPSGL